MSQRRAVALAAGGTAGHVMIALAIAEAFERAAPDIEIVFLGACHGTESTLVPARGFRLELLPGAPFQRQRLGGKLEALRQAANGLAQARKLLAAHSAQLVIGTGGYASLGALAAARSLGLATALHEANAAPGLANRLLGRIVDRVYLSSESATPSFPAGRCLVTGTPLRAQIARLDGRAKPPPPRDRPARVLVTAGSEGSLFLDREVPRLLGHVARLGVEVEARHQVGMGDPGRVRDAYASYGVAATIVRFIDDMDGGYDWADLVIACCGAGTVAELAIVGLPALLVPLAGASADHQRRNAEVYAEAGGAWIVPEGAWRAEDVGARTVEILRDPEAWSEACLSVRRLAMPNAADTLVSDCADWMIGRW